MSKGSKAKGAGGERELAALLMEWGSDVGVVLDLARNLEQVRGGGHDLIGLEDYGLAVEVKRVEKLQLGSWWRQAVRQADAVGCAPVLAFRQNRQPWRFKTRVWVYPCKSPLDVLLDLPYFEVWFKDILRSKLCPTTAPPPPPK